MQNKLGIEERDLLEGDPLLGSLRGVNEKVLDAYGGGTSGYSQSAKILKDLSHMKSSHALKSLNDRSL